MPYRTLKRNWVSVAVVAAIAFGTGLSIHNSREVDASLKGFQQDQIEFNVGACERGNILRAQVNEEIDAIRLLRDSSTSATTTAAQTAPDPQARLRYAAQVKKLEEIRFEELPLINCRTLVAEQTPPGS